MVGSYLVTSPFTVLDSLLSPALFLSCIFGRRGPWVARSDTAAAQTGLVGFKLHFRPRDTSADRLKWLVENYSELAFSANQYAMLTFTSAGLLGRIGRMPYDVTSSTSGVGRSGILRAHPFFLWHLWPLASKNTVADAWTEALSNASYLE